MMNSKTAPICNEDRRQDVRNPVNLQNEPNNFYVEFVGQTVPILDIRDVSVAGVGLILDRIITKGETISLGFKSDDTNLKINGTVAWCDTNSSPVAIGVEFSRENIHENVLFFMALRKFLDNFDCIPVDL